jgi:hypothetical protein
MPAFDVTTLLTASVATGPTPPATLDEQAALQGPGAIVITSTIGGAPSATVNIEGSADGVNWFNVPYALVATPSTFVLTALTITTAVTTTYLLQANQPWQFLRLNVTANNNVTLTAKAYL